MMQFDSPIPVVTDKGEDGYAIYVTNGSTFENDVWCVVLCNGGFIRHYLSSQLKIYANATFGIKKA